MAVVENVNARKIHLSARPLRKDLGETEELMASILEKGLLQPIIIRPDGGGFEVVAGNRRFEACRRLKLSNIPCQVVELDDREAYEISLVENLQRRTLNPIEEAAALKRYVDEYGYGGISVLAKMIGKSHSFVSRRIALLDLPMEVQEQLVCEHTTVSAAQELLSLDEKQKASVSQIIAKRKVTKSEIRQVVRRLKQLDKIDDEPATLFNSIENRRLAIDRALAKYIASLKICMIREDDIIESLDADEWIVSEILKQYRRVIHRQIDKLMKLKRTTQQRLPPACA